MKKRIIQTTLIAIATIALVSFTNSSRWISTGTDVKNYEMGEKVSSNNEGPGVTTIKSKDANITGYGALMQQIKAETFSGKRVKVSAIIKTSNVPEWGGLWLSVNQPYGNNNIILGNIKHTVCKGTLLGYKHEQIVMDVPVNSSGIAYGSMLKGIGQMWAGRVMFDIVDKSVPLSH